MRSPVRNLRSSAFVVFALVLLFEAANGASAKATPFVPSGRGDGTEQANSNGLLKRMSEEAPTTTTGDSSSDWRSGFTVHLSWYIIGGSAGGLVLLLAATVVLSCFCARRCCRGRSEDDQDDTEHVLGMSTVGLEMNTVPGAAAGVLHSSSDSPGRPDPFVPIAPQSQGAGSMVQPAAGSNSMYGSLLLAKPPPEQQQQQQYPQQQYPQQQYQPQQQLTASRNGARPYTSSISLVNSGSGGSSLDLRSSADGQQSQPLRPPAGSINGLVMPRSSSSETLYGQLPVRPPAMASQPAPNSMSSYDLRSPPAAIRSANDSQQPSSSSEVLYGRMPPAPPGRGSASPLVQHPQQRLPSSAGPVPASTLSLDEPVIYGALPRRQQTSSPGLARQPSILDLERQQQMPPRNPMYSSEAPLLNKSESGGSPSSSPFNGRSSGDRPSSDYGARVPLPGMPRAATPGSNPAGPRAKRSSVMLDAYGGAGSSEGPGSPDLSRRSNYY